MKPVLLALSVLLFSATPLAWAQTSGAEIHILDGDGTLETSFVPFPEATGSLGSVTAADLGNDGIAEIIVGAGANMQPLVRIFRQDGSVVGDFLAYDEHFMGGVNVASCDLDGDGMNEIVTGSGYGGGPQVRVFNHLGAFTGQQFFAYDAAFRGGVNVACGDVDGDGRMEIVTGPGLTGGPDIKVFTASGNLKTEVFTGPSSDSTGALVTVANIDADAAQEILASPAGLANPVVSVLGYHDSHLEYEQTMTTGLTPTFGTPVAVADTDHDGQAEILVSAGAYGDTSLAVFKTVGTLTGTLASGFTSLQGSLAPSVLPTSQGDKLLVADASTALGNTTSDKAIIVDLSEQRLTAYEHGLPVNSFLVSTGIAAHPTPVGTFAVTDKIPVMTYAWFYGAGNPNNYNLPNVKWNLRFKTHFYIHSAYWHHNFGHVMSHGCVNTSIPDADWIYHWADVGTSVTIKN